MHLGRGGAGRRLLAAYSSTCTSCVCPRKHSQVLASKRLRHTFTLYLTALYPMDPCYRLPVRTTIIVICQFYPPQSQCVAAAEGTAPGRCCLAAGAGAGPRLPRVCVQEGRGREAQGREGGRAGHGGGQGRGRVCSFRAVAGQDAVGHVRAGGLTHTCTSHTSWVNSLC